MIKILATILTSVLMITGGFLASKQKTTVTVINATNNNGKVSFALFDEVTFIKTPLEAKSEKIIDGRSSVTFENIGQGKYSVICFHDENNNGKMDFNENVIPTEGYDASNNILTFGPPSYLGTKFTLAEEDLTLEVKFF
ncbi:DUF2141 domain-containing protein [Flavobacteriaceae bacterium]|nr:DUF2141 domain-containing protein [Flavobacteriaceae bacterium]